MNLIPIKKFYQSFIRLLIIYLFFHLSKRNTFFTMKLSFRFLTLIFLNHVEKIDSKIYSNHGTENEVKNSYPQIPRRILSPRSLSVSLSQKKNLLRSTFHDATMQYPVTVVRIFLLAAICMTQRRISRTPSVTLLVRRRKRGWTRGRR